MKLSGVVPPVATPLLDGDRVDEQNLRRVDRYLVDAGVNAIFANGSMGGFAFLTDEEQLRSIGITVSEVAGAVPVLGGVGETSTSRAVRMARQVARLGVDYISVLPPFYFLAKQEHLIAFFCEIAAAVDTPMVLYDNPVLTKNPIQPETVAELRRRIPHLMGIKVSNPDFTHLHTVLSLMKDDPDFAVLTGSEFLIVVALGMGCSGFVGGLHTLCPQIAVELYDAFRRGDIARAEQCQRELTATWQIFRRGSIWGAFDEALRYLGLAERGTGRPYITELGAEDREAVHQILDTYVKPRLSAPAATR
jgi:4-hydroxy-tetrahydrodipicolinate synthase